MFQSPYGDFGTPTPPSSDASSISLRCFSPLTGILVMRPDLPWAADQRRKRFSPLTGILVMRRGCRKSVRELVILVSVPLRGFWYSDNLRLYIIIAILSFSPLTGILVLWRQRALFDELDNVSFSPLTGILVLWPSIYIIRYKLISEMFQSPYGDFGTLTLPPSTRPLTGLTGDFFKPPAFLAFFGDPGEK